jgi:hypothetical protein
MRMTPEHKKRISEAMKRAWEKDPERFHLGRELGVRNKLRMPRRRYRRGPAEKEALRQSAMRQETRTNLQRYLSLAPVERTPEIWNDLFPTFERHALAVAMLRDAWTKVRWMRTLEPERKPPAPCAEVPKRFADSPVTPTELPTCEETHRNRETRGLHRCLAHDTYLSLPHRCPDCPSLRRRDWMRRFMSKLLKHETRRPK